MLKRAADAIRDSKSGDCIVLARRALEAAVRTESDLLELLHPDREANSTLQRSREVTMSALPQGADVIGAVG